MRAARASLSDGAAFDTAAAAEDDDPSMKVTVRAGVAGLPTGEEAASSAVKVTVKRPSEQSPPPAAPASTTTRSTAPT